MLRIEEYVALIMGAVAVDSFGITSSSVKLPVAVHTEYRRSFTTMAALGGGGVVGDGNELANSDGLQVIMQARGPAIAKALQLSTSNHGQPKPTGLQDIVAGRAWLLKQVVGISGTAGHFFGAPKNKWVLLETEADGSCGFQARAIMEGIDASDQTQWPANLSLAMMNDLHQYQAHGTWMDVGDLIIDLINTQPSFNGRVVWIRSIALMHAQHEKCSVSIRANRFMISPNGPFHVPDAGAWPLAATPIEPSSPTLP